MTKVSWIRLEIDMFDNKKIRHIRKLPEGNNIVLIWMMLLTMAGRCNSNGIIFLTENIPYTNKMLADELDFDESVIELALTILEKFGMITRDGTLLSIPGWEEHQNIDGLEKIREQTRKRVAEHRKRQKGLSEEDYFFLESTYDDFTTVYDDRTPAQKLIFRQIAKALLEGEKAIKSGNTAGFEKMNNLVSKLMNDGNIKPIQEATIAEEDTQCWGVWVNRIETERPVGEAGEQFRDVDKISSYITKWFTKQMQRAFALGDGGEEDVDQN